MFRKKPVLWKRINVVIHLASFISVLGFFVLVIDCINIYCRTALRLQSFVIVYPKALDIDIDNLYFSRTAIYARMGHV